MSNILISITYVQIFKICVQWKATSGTKNYGPNNNVILLVMLKSTSEPCLRLTKSGHYNEVV